MISMCFEGRSISHCTEGSEKARENSKTAKIQTFLVSDMYYYPLLFIKIHDNSSSLANKNLAIFTSDHVN